MEIEAAFAAAKERGRIWYGDPIAFCRDVFPPNEQPTIAQQEILMSLVTNRQTVAKAHRGWGKAICLKTDVLTPLGWVVMGDITAGREVLNEHGKPCRVTNVSPVYVGRPCFRVEFSSGEAITCDEDHLWTVFEDDSSSSVTLPTWLMRDRGAERYSIPAAGEPHRRHMITAIVPVPSVPVRCLTVDNPTGLFLVGRTCVPTHNSRTAAYAAWWWFITRCSLVMTLAPVWAQATESIWVEIRHLWAVSSLPKMFPDIRVLTTEVHSHPLLPKMRMLSAAASDVSNIEGRHSAKTTDTLVIADECKKIPDAFRFSLEGMLTRAGSRFLGIGTPGIPLGWYFKAFEPYNTTYQQFSFSAATSHDPDVRAQAARLALPPSQGGMGEDDPFYRQQWLAEFTGAEEGSIITSSLLKIAIERAFTWQPSWKKIMSLDPAGAGTNFSVLSYRWGPILLVQEAWQGWDILKSEERVIAAATSRSPASAFDSAHQRILDDDWRPDIFVIDEGGLGQGTVAHVRAGLRHTNIQVVPYVSGARPRNPERYLNRKSEDIYRLRDRLREGVLEVQAAQALWVQETANITDPDQLERATREMQEKLKTGAGISLPDEPTLLEQLCSWTADPNSLRAHALDPKVSPDHADSALMGFSVDDVPAMMKGHKGGRRITG